MHRERERYFKFGREVKRLKECALALTIRYVYTNYSI